MLDFVRWIHHKDFRILELFEGADDAVDEFAGGRCYFEGGRADLGGRHRVRHGGDELEHFFVVGSQQVRERDRVLAIGVFVDRVGAGGDVDTDGMVEKFVFEAVDYLGGVGFAKGAEEVLFVIKIAGADSFSHAQDCLADSPGGAETYRIEGGGESAVGLLEQTGCGRSRCTVAERLVLIRLGKLIGAGPSFSELGHLALGAFEGGVDVAEFHLHQIFGVGHLQITT